MNGVELVRGAVHVARASRRRSAPGASGIVGTTSQPSRFGVVDQFVASRPAGATACRTRPGAGRAAACRCGGWRGRRTACRPRGSARRPARPAATARLPSPAGSFAGMPAPPCRFGVRLHRADVEVVDPHLHRAGAGVEVQHEPVDVRAGRVHVAADLRPQHRQVLAEQLGHVLERELVPLPRLVERRRRR